MWRNECAANGVGTTASANSQAGTKTPPAGTPAVPKCDCPQRAPTSAKLAGLTSRLGFQTGTGAHKGRLSGSPRHGGDCTAALTLAMDREAMEAEETASNDRPMTQAPERDKRISALARRTCAILLATPEYRLDDILSHKAGMPRRQAQRTDPR